MTEIDAKILCEKLLAANSENEVEAILSDCSLWDNKDYWRDFGDNENNYSTAGAQQSDPIAALVEKLVNCVDARLMNECLAEKIPPDSDQAPRSVREAVAKFIEKSPAPERETNGRIENWTSSERLQHSQNITLAASGSKSSPCLSIFDQGEGQTPDRVPDTFMSLNKSNKLRIPFVQGKFNMGGTGVFRFCGQMRIQLVITRRNTTLLDNPSEDDIKWSFTVVRRETPSQGERNSVYRYLAPVNIPNSDKRGVLRFSSNEMKIAPEDNQPYARSVPHGSLVKLYNYNFKGKSHILMKDGLLSSVGIRLPNPALPIRFHECRAYSGDATRSFSNTFTGLVVRLADDKAGNLEEGFPYDDILTVDGQQMSVRIYGFKKGKADSYRNKSEGVLFVVNGQSQGTLHSRFFKRNSVKFGYIADSLLLYVDCSKLDRWAQEELFMNTRESLAESDFRAKLEKQLERLVRDQQALRDFNNRRRQEKIKDKIEDDKALEDTLNSIMKSSPTLSALFLGGQRLSSAFDNKAVQTSDDFNGKEFPTYFNHQRSSGVVFERACQVGRSVRLGFETDAENNYFGRPKEAGQIQVECTTPEGESMSGVSWRVNLVNGIASLSLDFGDHTKVGDQVGVQVTVSDSSRLEPFIKNAVLTFTPKVENTSNGGSRKKPASKEDGESRQIPSGIALPNVIPVRKEEWSAHDFDKFSAMKIQQSDDGESDGKRTYDFFLNMDNDFLLNELKHAKGNEDVVAEQFKVGMVLVALALIHDAKAEKEAEEIESRVYVATKALALMLIPMITSLGQLDMMMLENQQEAA